MPEEAEDVHREERDVEPDEHRPEADLAEPLAQHLAGHLREPEVERAEDREHDRAVQHVVEVRDDEVAVGDLPVERQHRHHHAGDPAEQEDQQEADREEHRRREADDSLPHRRDPREELDAARDRDDEARGGEERQRERGDAGREHVVDPHAEADERDDHECGRDPDVAGEPLPREHRDDHRDHAGGGDEQDVHLGMAPEPEQVLVEQRAAAVADDVEGRAEQPVELEQRRPRPSPPAPRR